MTPIVWLTWYGPPSKSSILQSSNIKVSISVGKKYDTEEEKLRFSAFSRNIESIELHNSEAEAGKFTYRLGVHEFADMVSSSNKAGICCLPGLWEKRSRRMLGEIYMPSHKSIFRMAPDSWQGDHYNTKYPRIECMILDFPGRVRQLKRYIRVVFGNQV